MNVVTNYSVSKTKYANKGGFFTDIWRTNYAQKFGVSTSGYISQDSINIQVTLMTTLVVLQDERYYVETFSS